MSSIVSSCRKSATPSSILKKHTSLKSRLSQISATPTKVKFVLPHSTKVRKIVRDFIHKENVKEYEHLLCLIRDSHLTDDDIISLLKEATQCISLLSHELRLFVDALLTIDWINRSDSVIKAYKSFIVSLLTAHNYHTERVIGKLVSFFILDASCSADDQRCVNVHSLLKTLLEKVPMCKDVILKCLTARYPYSKKPSTVHEHYLENILWIVEYQPTLRFAVLELVVSNLLVMDINAPRDEVEKFYEEDDEEMFTMDDVRTVSGLSVLPDGKKSPVVNTLDVCLDKLFTFMMAECSDPDTNELNWEKTKGLYHDILRIFDKQILPTHKIHHVQYIMFLLCSFKPAIVEAVLNFLWSKVKNPNVSNVTRQAAVNYIVSFLARATYVTMPVLKGTLEEMAQWIHSYISVQDSFECVSSDLRTHRVFYTTCQALFYVVAFRHKDLVQSRKNLIFLESLNMGKIVTSRLNPLRVCQPAVVQNFAAIARKYQLAYCYSVIEHNARNVLPTIYDDEEGQSMVSNSVLEAFYPFDPYLLKISGQKIYPHYRDYKEINFEQVRDVHMRDAVDVDDFLENYNEISPSPKLGQFSYGTSPGFKLKYH